MYVCVCTHTHTYTYTQIIFTSDFIKLQRLNSSAWETVNYTNNSARASWTWKVVTLELDFNKLSRIF